MILANIVGGLGNQMFQYAFARALSLRSGTPLKLAIDMFDSYAGHQGFELVRAFDIQAAVASPQELSDVLGWRRRPSIRRLLAKLKWPMLMSRSFVAERFFRFHEVSFAGPRVAYFHGYWQSPRYYEDHEASIRADFKFAQPLVGLNWQLAAEMAATESISVHIRRGDYLKNPRSRMIYALCDREYYMRAIEQIASRRPGARVFAFSDDPAWVESTFRLAFPNLTIIAHNKGIDSHFDMHLMSLCKHHVIANSTFSWWGAWLGARASQLVVAPQNWFVSGKDSEDLLPATWART